MGAAWLRFYAERASYESGTSRERWCHDRDVVDN